MNTNAENVIVSSVKYTKLLKKITTIGIALAIVVACFSVIRFFTAQSEYIAHANKHSRYGDWSYGAADNGSCKLCNKYVDWSKDDVNAHAPMKYAVDQAILLLIIGAVIAIVVVVGKRILDSYELTITDKRIYGKVAFGKRVDLPIDSISAISIRPLMKGVAVSTASGKISFLLLENVNQIYDVMNKLLIERQEQTRNAPVTAPVVTMSNADELKKYKELLDTGIITQEEFDAKKKQLLGL